MTHDNDMRKDVRTGIAAYRGCGVNITMMCARCKQPRPQLGSKKLPWRGAKRGVCRRCVEELGK